MQATTIITRVRRQLVETVGAFWSDSELLSLINDAERDFNNKTRILEDSAQLTTVSGQRNYPLPANWLSARAIFLNNPDDDGTPHWKRVRPTNLEKIAQERPNFLSDDTESFDVPKQYWLWSRELNLDKVPDDAYTIKMYYKSKPIALSVASSELNIDDSFSDAIESYVKWKAWSKEKEFDLAEQAKTEYMEFVREGRKFVKKQSGDARLGLDIESSIPFSGSTGGDPLFLE